MSMPVTRWATGLGLGLALSASLALPAAHAKDFPQRSVEVVVGYPAGASLDILARLLQPKMSEVLGEQVIVENRAGAGGNIGTANVARSDPDGHRILLASNANLSINPHIYPDAGFDPFEDFEPITQLASGPVALVVNTSTNIESVQDLLDRAKANPGSITYGTPGVGSPMHLLGEMMAQEADFEWTHVPYKGSVPALTDLMGGNIDVSISTLATTTPFLDSGKLKVIALAEAEPFVQAPDSPLLADTIPGLTAPAWFAFVAPAGTPQEAIDALYEASVAALEDPAVIKGLEAGAMVPAAHGPEALTELIRADYDAFGKVIEERGIRAN